MSPIPESDVDSSAIARVAYEDKRRELYVRFHSGAAYTYYDVPMAEYLALMEAESVGTFVNQVIKPKYELRKGAPI